MRPSNVHAGRRARLGAPAARLSTAAAKAKSGVAPPGPVCRTTASRWPTPPQRGQRTDPILVASAATARPEKSPHWALPFSTASAPGIRPDPRDDPAYGCRADPVALRAERLPLRAQAPRPGRERPGQAGPREAAARRARVRVP